MDRSGLRARPDSVVARIVLAVHYLYNENDSRTIELGDEILSLSPDEPIGLMISGTGHWFAGNEPEAEDLFRQNVDGAWSWLQTRIALAQIVWKSDRHEEALDLLAPAVESLEENVAQGASLWWVFYSLAQTHALRGETARAYELLERAIDAGAPSYRVYQRDPCFEGMRHEERYQRLMNRIEERVDEMRARFLARESEAR